MFQGFSGATVDFMWGIRFNNEKGWFEAHKEEYLTTFQRPMKALADEGVRGLYRPPSRPGPHLQGVPSTGTPGGSSAAAPTRTICG